MERTFAIIKPDACKRSLAGKILAKIEEKCFRVIADPGTIRKEFAQSVEANSVHGSDAPETAEYETKFFFSTLELSA